MTRVLHIYKDYYPPVLGGIELPQLLDAEAVGLIIATFTPDGRGYGRRIGGVGGQY